MKQFTTGDLLQMHWLCNKSIRELKYNHGLLDSIKASDRLELRILENRLEMVNTTLLSRFNHGILTGLNGRVK